MISNCLHIRAAPALLVYLTTALVAQAAPIALESATQDAVDLMRYGGYVVASSQFLGWRFTVDQDIEVTAVGGNFSGSGELFAALISLSGPNGLPKGSPFLQQELLATTMFEVVGFHDDLLTPLSASLTPGVYGLIYGSGAFGASGQSTMSYLTGNPLSSPDRFRWDTDNLSGVEQWKSGGAPTRFVVQGNSVPVPDTGPGVAGVAVLAALLVGGIEILGRDARLSVQLGADD